MKIYRNFLLPTGLLAGTIIGAGVFALPFVFLKAGILSGLFYLALGTSAYLLIHLFYADIILRTEGEHRFVGYAQIYLGRAAFWLAILMAVLEMIFILTIYLVLSASFSNLFAGAGAGLFKVLIFWVLGSATIFLSLKRVAFLEFLITWGMILIIGLIFVLGLGKLGKIGALDFYPNLVNFFVPLAPILFALSGRVAIPSLVKYFRIPGVGHNHALIKKAITAGTIIPAVVYAFFVFGVFGLSNVVSEDSVSGLLGQVPSFVLVIIGILGILSLWSSYIVVGLDVESILRYDLKISKAVRILFVVLAPLALYFLSSQDFIGLVGFVGGIFLALEGIFIILMWLRARKIAAHKPMIIGKTSWAVIGLIMLTFISALLYEAAKPFS